MTHLHVAVTVNGMTSTEAVQSAESTAALEAMIASGVALGVVHNRLAAAKAELAAAQAEEKAAGQTHRANSKRYEDVPFN